MPLVQHPKLPGSIETWECVLGGAALNQSRLHAENGGAEGTVASAELSSWRILKDCTYSVALTHHFIEGTCEQSGHRVSRNEKAATLSDFVPAP